MMTAKRLTCWIMGTFASFMGVYLVRALSLQVTDNYKLGVMLVGYALAILGLFIITIGTRRKS